MGELDILGLNLSRFRKKNNLSYQAVGDAIGISAAHVCRIENATAKPSFDVLINISRLMNVPLYYLFLDSSEHVDLSDFIAKIKTQLEKLDMSLERLAKDTGINLFRLLDILQEKMQPTSEELALLADKLQIAAPNLPVDQRIPLLERLLEDLNLDAEQVQNIIQYVSKARLKE